MKRCSILGLLSLLLTLVIHAQLLMSPAADAPRFSEVAADIIVPQVETASPTAGRRVRATTAGWEGTEVHHALYLPRDWKPGANLPVLVEYAGNGGFRNQLGDTCDGTVEGCNLGYGLSAGEGFIWIAIPFVEIADGTKRNARNWWGDVAETKRYCAATVREVCARFGGDAERVVLCGFSRGAIACNFIGLHDDDIAKLWRAFFCHSHYDGVREHWPYPGADRASAISRLQRLGDRPQWISQENSVAATRTYIDSSGVKGRFTFETLPFPNHTDTWLLRDIPLREKARDWLREAVR